MRVESATMLSKPITAMTTSICNEYVPLLIFHRHHNFITTTPHHRAPATSKPHSIAPTTPTTAHLPRVQHRARRLSHPSVPRRCDPNATARVVRARGAVRAPLPHRNLSAPRPRPRLPIALATRHPRVLLPTIRVLQVGRTLRLSSTKYYYSQILSPVSTLTHG